MRFLALLLVLPQVLWAQNYTPTSGHRSGTTVRFYQAERVGTMGILQFYAVDEKDASYSFTIPDGYYVLKGGDILVESKTIWCAATIGRSMIGILHAGACKPNELDNPPMNFIGTTDIKKQLAPVATETSKNNKIK